MNSRFRRMLLRPLLGLVAAGALLGATAHAAAEDVTYLLPAPANLPAFAPWMLALHKGYYAAEGLNVNFLAAKGGVDVAKQLGSGNAVTGGAIGDTPIIARANGVPVKAVALLGGRSLMHLAVHEGGDIRAPQDLKGKTVTALSYQDTTFYALLGMLRTAGLSKNDLSIQAAGPAGVWQLFAAGKSDAMASVPDWTATVIEEGGKVRILPADDYFKSMAQAILASDEVIRTKPELVRKLVRATLRGLKDIIDDPRAAARDYVAAVPAHQGKEVYIGKVFELYGRYVYPGQAVLGEVDAQCLRQVQDFYVAEGIVARATPLAELFTNRFVQ